MPSNDSLLQSAWAMAVQPALVLLPPRMSSPRAWHMLLAIGLQESKFSARVQIVNGGGRGPARGFWQFERGGGVKGVLEHDLTTEHAVRICDARGVRPVAQLVWERMEFDDVLGAAFARLLLWTDRPPLPAPDNADGGWETYTRVWRPGRPHPATWPAHWTRARRFIYGE